MCQTTTIGEIARQKNEKLHVSIVNRFLKPTELLARYHNFYSNAEPLISPQNDSDALLKNLFKEREAEFKNALQKIDTTFSYDTETKVLFIRLGTAKYKQSIDHGSYLLDIGEDGSAIGITIFNVIL